MSRLAGSLVAARVTKSYGAEVVLQDVSLVVPSRARIGLVGPNGAGKSTLLRLLAGLGAGLGPHPAYAAWPRGRLPRAGAGRRGPVGRGRDAGGARRRPPRRLR